MTRRRDLRAEVFARDRGVCAACGLDCEQLAHAFSVAEQADHAEARRFCGRCGEDAMPGSSGPCLECGTVAYMRIRIPETNRRPVLERMLAAKFPPGFVRDFAQSHTRRPLWEADHEVPLSEDGADTAANARTLCKPCHLEATRPLMARRARARRADQKRAARERNGQGGLAMRRTGAPET